MIRAWARGLLGALTRLEPIERLEERVLSALADLWYRKAERPMKDYDMKITRILHSHDQFLTVTGTSEEIEAAAKRMARRTRSCVSILVLVGHYHVRGCDQRPSGGIQMEGN